MVKISPTVDHEELKFKIFSAVKDMYTEVASCPAKEFHFPTGRVACEYVGYSSDELDFVPETAAESFAGVGFPFKANVIKKGDVVLDIGSGSGTDIFIAAHKTGDKGTVYGLEITDAMIEKIENNVARSGLNNISVIEGNAESIPLPDEYVDVVTSNGVINLVPDKLKVFSEIYRVLKPGGKIQISDIALSQDISEKSRMNPQLWAECIVGAVEENGYVHLIRNTGFIDVHIIDRMNYFNGSPNESTKKAAEQYGAISITLTAIKNNFF
jgi:SAM-dependent methyltransferase